MKAEFALELAKLTDSLRIAEGMLVAFAVVDDYPTRESIIAELRLRLEDELALREIHLSAEQPDLYNALQAAPGAGERTAYCVYGFEELSGAARQQATRGLNVRREMLRELGHPLILWMTGENLASLARTAPDFYAWRSALYEFGAAQLSDGSRASPIPHMLEIHSRSLIPPKELRKRAALYRQRIKELEAAESPNLAAISGFQHQLGSIHDELGELDTALDYYRRSLDIAERLGDQTSVADILNNIGNIYANKGEWDTALDYYRRSLDIKERLGDQASAAGTLNNIGNIYDFKGEWEAALDYFSRSLDIRERLGDQANAATTLNNIGEVHRKQGEWEVALDYYRRSLDINERLGDQAVAAITLNNIGAIHTNKGEWEAALDYYRRSLDIRERLGDQAGAANTLNNIGIVYYKQGEWEAALDYYRRSLDIKERLGDQAGTAGTLNNIGEVYRRQGGWEAALDYFRRSLDIAERLRDVVGMSNTYWNVGLIYEQQDELEQAIECIEQAVEIKRRIGHPDAEKNAAHLEKLRRKTGHFRNRLLAAMRRVFRRETVNTQFASPSASLQEPGTRST